MAGPALAFQTGDHASRPAASAGCVLYSCTDHSLVYRSDGSSWSTLITLVSGLSNPMTTAGDVIQSSDGSGTPARLALGSQGSYLRAGASAVEYQKNNLAATAAPDADNDVDEGYTVGSAWFDTTNDEVYFCVDNSDGAAVWKQVGSGSGGSTELDYVEITSDVSITSTSTSSPTTVITGTSQSYAAVPIFVEFGTSGITPNAAANANIIVQLWDGATNLGRIAQVINPASAVYRTPAVGRMRFTPSAGTHQYIIKAYQAGGNGTINAGTGATNGSTPAYIRITTA